MFDQPLDKRITIPVCFACDDNYAIPCMVALTSLLINSNENNFDIFVLDGGISGINKINIVKITKFFKAKTSFVKVDSNKYLKKIPLPENGHFNQVNYFRLMIPSLIKEYEKIIYLDCDLIVRKNINEIFKIDISEQYLAAAKAQFTKKNNMRLVKSKNSTYINSGVLLINSKKWREDAIEKKLFKHIFSISRKKLLNVDQDAINYVLGNKNDIRLFSQRWNAEFRTDIKPLDSYKKVLRDPHIIQYLSSDKPWQENSKQNSEEYNKYYKIVKKIILDKKEYISLQFLKRNGYIPNIDEPKSFNEKIQWLKLYFKNPLLTKCTDKLLVRDYIKDKIGEKYLIPLIGVYNNTDEINFDKLPNQFVLKTNNAAGRNIICKDKNKLNIEEAKFKLKEWLKFENWHYFFSYEWAYKDIKPKIICEKYIEEESGDLTDYKIYCFHGKPKFIRTFRSRYKQIKKNTYDLEWNPINFSIDCKNSKKHTPRPKHLKEMIKISEELSKDFPFIRVDLYDLKNTIFFGELTCYPASGLNPIIPRSADYKIGKLLDLNKILVMNTHNYLKNKKNRKSKTVIYTTIVGDYDQLIQHKYVSNEFDYVCFTDQKINNPGIWEIKKLKFINTDNTRLARYYKIFPNKILSKYDYSIWIDANIDVLDNSLEKNVKRLIKAKKTIGVIPHFERDCIYKEAETCIKLKKDKQDTILKQIKFLKKEKYPKDNKLFETNLLFRKHGKNEIIAIMNDWWKMINNYSKRDQLSFNYVLWKNKMIADELLPQNARLTAGFDFKEHLSERKKKFAISKNKLPEINYLININRNLQNQTQLILLEINRLESDLNKIKSLKFFKLWQSYNKLKRLI